MPCRLTITTAAALMLAGCATGGVLDASWVAPITNADGTPLTDVVSYRVYYGTTDPPCPGGKSKNVAPPKGPPSPGQRVAVRLTGLTVGELYYVAVTAVNSHGLASRCTSSVSARARLP